MKKFRIVFVLLVILALTLAACGGDDDNGGSDGGLDLSQTASSTMEGAGTLSVNYPDGWATRNSEDGTIEIASSQDVLDLMDSDGNESPEKGQSAYAVMFLPTEMVAMVAGSEDPSAVDLVSVFSGFMAAEGGEANLGEASEAEVGGNTAGVLSGTITEDGRTLGAAFVAIKVDGGFAMVIGAGHEEEVSTITDNAKAIGGTVKYEG